MSAAHTTTIQLGLGVGHSLSDKNSKSSGHFSGRRKLLPLWNEYGMFEKERKVSGLWERIPRRRM